MAQHHRSSALALVVVSAVSLRAHASEELTPADPRAGGSGVSSGPLGSGPVGGGAVDAAREQGAARRADTGWSADVEIDPIAYAAGGYSVHVGLGHGRLRLDLGAFAADVPEWLHQNEGFEARMDGFGTKLDVFLREDGTGPFAGLEAALAATTLRSPDDVHDFERNLQVGARAGWRVPLGAGFYATPWIGVDYALGAGDRQVGAHRFEASPWVVFPTVHLGYRFKG